MQRDIEARQISRDLQQQIIGESSKQEAPPTSEIRDLPPHKFESLTASEISFFEKNNTESTQQPEEPSSTLSASEETQEYISPSSNDISIRCI